MNKHQLDFFGSGETALSEISPPVMGADPARVRRNLAGMLAEVREAGAFGLPEKRRRFIETVVPQMVNWLPEDEARKVRQEFEQALAV